MKRTSMLLGLVLVITTASSQPNHPTSPAKVMALGVFHFAYPNLDAKQTSGQDQVSVLEEPWQAEIRNIAQALAEFKPTVIAVEFTPDVQPRVDSLYARYRAGQWELKKNEVYQLGFRLGKLLNLDRIHCVDDPGKHYPAIEGLLQDSTRLARFEQYYLNPPDLRFVKPAETKKVSSIVSALMEANDPVGRKKAWAPTWRIPFSTRKRPEILPGLILRPDGGLTETFAFTATSSGLPAPMTGCCSLLAALT